MSNHAILHQPLIFSSQGQPMKSWLKRFLSHQNNQPQNQNDLFYLSNVRDGYERERALKALFDNNPNKLSDELWHLLILRQNDYVLPIRQFMLTTLLKHLRTDNLEEILKRMDKLWHLRTQSRSDYNTIFNKLVVLFSEQHNFENVLIFLQKHQGTSVRALFEFLIDYRLIDKNEQIQIALSSPDIGICQRAYGQIIHDDSIDLLKLLAAHYPKPLPIKNRRFYAMLLHWVIKKYPINDWQPLAIGYLAYATKSQADKLLFTLKRQGLDNAALSKLLIDEFGEDDGCDIILSLIYHTKDMAWMKFLIINHPAWHTKNLQLWYEVCLLILPDDTCTKNLIQQYPDLSVSFYTKQMIFKTHAITTLPSFYHYTQLLQLTDDEALIFAKYLTTWELLFYLLDYADTHKDDELPKLFFERVHLVYQRFEHKTIYVQSLSPAQKDRLKQAFDTPYIRKHFSSLIQPLKWMKAI